MEVPEIKFTKTGDGVNLAYQRFGKGPDLIVIPAMISNVEIQWEHEIYRRASELLDAHVRVLAFDKRGIGLSDRYTKATSPEQRIGDILAVMDTEGIERASLCGFSEGGVMAQLFAARYPERVDRMVLINSTPGASVWDSLSAYGDEPQFTAHEIMEYFVSLVESWGKDPQFFIERFMPSRCGDAAFERWVARFQRQTASPADVQRQYESIALLDASNELDKIKAPTLVIHTAGDRVVPVTAGRYLADKIAGAEYFELAGDDHFCWVSDNWRDLVGAIIKFVTGTVAPAQVQRKFVTVLFTDIVDSTARSAAVGDQAWHETLTGHDEIAWKTTDRHGGRVVKNLGDGFLVTFDNPASALDCARELSTQWSDIGISVRAGLHSGAVELRENGDVSGIAVNLAARVEEAAEDGSIYVSSTVHDMLLGGEWAFEDRGEHTLKGIDGAWRLYSVAG